MAAGDDPVLEDYWTVPGLSPRRSSQTAEGESADFDAVVRHYGEAMWRLGRLEARAELDQVSNNGQADAIERVAALEALAARPSPSRRTTASPDRQVAAQNEHQQEDDDLRQLRLLNGNLSHRLAQSERSLQAVESEGARRRKRQRPLWKRIAHRVGLR